MNPTLKNVIAVVAGIVTASMIGGSVTFIVVDLVFAYIPMAILGRRFAGVPSQD